MKDFEINEASGSVAGELTGRRMKVRLIEGNRLGASAYYPAEVLRRDGPKVFKRGTPMFINHQTSEEKHTRPFGSIHDFVGELAEDAYYDNDGLYAEVEVFEDSTAMIKARKDRIGISIRANVLADEGEINGVTTKIVREFTSVKSADFVMRPGAGGKIVTILESAREDDHEVAEDGENMTTEEVIEAAVASFKTAFDARFTAIEEQLKALPVAEVVAEETATEVVAEETATDDVDVNAKALEIAEAFAGSSLDAEGRKRVLALHKADGTAIADLIEAEEAYVSKHTVSTDDAQGVEESADADTEVEESASKGITIPAVSGWGKAVK